MYLATTDNYISLWLGGQLPFVDQLCKFKKQTDRYMDIRVATENCLKFPSDANTSHGNQHTEAAAANTQGKRAASPDPRSENYRAS